MPGPERIRWGEKKEGGLRVPRGVYFYVRFSFTGASLGLGMAENSWRQRTRLRPADERKGRADDFASSFCVDPGVPFARDCGACVDHALRRDCAVGREGRAGIL